MINNISRIGRFTSSQIGKLMTKDRSGKGFGAPALTYIEEKNMERRLGRCVNTEVSSRPTSWGNLVELQAFNLLGTKYKPTSKDTFVHNEFDYWSGSPDGWYDAKEYRTVYDLKCPITLKSFCNLSDCSTVAELIENHKEGEIYFYQLVSNAILTGAKYAELIIYCPYREELDAIRELAQNYDGNQNKVAWINWAEDADLPYLIKGNHYRNLNMISFEVTDEMKTQLTARIIEAGKLLNAMALKKEEVKEISLDAKRILAQEKIRLMEELRKRLRSNNVMPSIEVYSK